MKETFEEFCKRMKKQRWEWTPFTQSGNPRPETYEWFKENNPSYLNTP